MALDYKAAVVVLTIVFISTVSAARVVPLSIIQKPFGAVNIFDNSKYGLLQLSNGLAQTPPLGWNSWNFFACDINETLIKETSDALVSTGLADLGYNYVNIDDCWESLSRDSKMDPKFSRNQRYARKHNNQSSESASEE